MTSFVNTVIEKMKEMAFINLFLFLFGGVLIIVGTAETIKLFEFTLVMKDEFRWLITGMGFVFILMGIVWAIFKERSQITFPHQPTITNDVPPFYIFHGLEKELRSDAVFQNFEIERVGGTNRNAVYYMWADTYNTIALVRQ